MQRLGMPAPLPLAYTALHTELLCALYGNMVRPRPPIVVAIPARDEAGRIAGCLAGLAGQRGVPEGSFAVLLLVNNASDATATIARSLSDHLPFRLIVLEAQLPPELAHAGAARRLAMDLAAEWLGRNVGLILTTDADSRVAPDWMAATLSEFARGADAVAGAVSFHKDETEVLPARLRRRIRLEEKLGAMLTELSARIDPEIHNAWPRHARTSGASLAITSEWYRRIGGLPLLALGEDRALADSVVAAGGKLRHSPAVRVATSARLEGRAPGGTADTIARQSEQPTMPCDPDLEPVLPAVRRARWRRYLRALHQAERLESPVWTKTLEIDQALARRLRGIGEFNRFWTAVQRSSPILHRRRVWPRELPLQIAIGRAALFTLRMGGVATGPIDRAALDAGAPASRAAG